MRTGVLVLLAVGLHPLAASGAQERTGKQVYDSICITCHGPDGKGKANAELMKIITPPDFTDCRFAAREADRDWIAVAHRGGPVRGFSPLMAPWAGAYTTNELTLAVGHIRTFCTDARWPRGELNLPRPLVTGKAFPEDEAVISTSASTKDAGQFSSTLVYEKRFGPLNQVEIAVPIARAAIGRTFEQGQFGRNWSPMIEILGARAFADGARTNWDIVPQMQITLNARQHVRVNGGVRLPVNTRDGRSATVIVYLLWDWFDGGLFDGW